MRRTRLSIPTGAITLLLLCATSVFAQPERESHFGVLVSFALPSQVHDQFKPIYADASRVDAETKDFQLGFIVRGRHLGGDWGVSYIQKGYKDGSVIDNSEEQCFQGCFTYGTVDTMQDVRLRGLAVNKFAPFVTIKQRVQIGIDFGGGVGWAKGTAERRTFGTQFVPPNGMVQTETVTQVDAKELFVEQLDPMPIWKVELAGAVLLAPGLKVRAGGGLNFTNYPSFTISGVYLIGSK